MSKPAVTMGDKVVGVDIHIVLVPAPPGPPVPTPLPHPFSGTILQNCCMTVLIGGKPAATLGSIAMNVPPHIMTPPGVSFVIPPTNQGNITMGSMTVLIGGKPAARVGDLILTCNDPVPAPTCQIIPSQVTVLIGG